ncbi:HNH endonuclease signature motif containing protein [Streptomyces sp. NPDC048623]|uniref:HNH endonuclease n=1 Tax=Streptomyces sp. NPDC048623 TaxID=3155761 RepID=UPI003433E056
MSSVAHGAPYRLAPALGTRVPQTDCPGPPLRDVDHVRPLSMGGTDTDGNVQVLCRGCHGLKTSTEFGNGAASPLAQTTTATPAGEVAVL